MDRFQRHVYCKVCETVEDIEDHLECEILAKNQFMSDAFTELAARLLTCANKLREPDKE
jgi:hypothetical protein